MGKETATEDNNKDVMWFFDVERSISFMCALSITLLEIEGETHTYRSSGETLDFRDARELVNKKILQTWRASCTPWRRLDDSGST
jgi:hypothetical protein